MSTTLAARPRVRLLPAPAFDPPFDDERDPDRWAALSAEPLLELVKTPRLRRPPSNPPPAAPLPAGPSAQTRTAASRFMNTCLEILNGYRPVAHVRALSEPLYAATVLDEMTRALRRTAGTTATTRVVLRRMRICEPRPGVAEISAVLTTRADNRSASGAGDGEQCWAAAFRLERRQGRWLCQVAHVL